MKKGVVSLVWLHRGQSLGLAGTRGPPMTHPLSPWRSGRGLGESKLGQYIS